ALRGRRRPRPRRRLQLLDLHPQGLPAPDRRAVALPAARRRRRPHHVPLRHDDRAASVLPPLRCVRLLRPPLASRPHRRERALPRRRRPDDARGWHVRRPQLGSEHPDAEGLAKGAFEMSMRSAFLLGVFLLAAALAHGGIYAAGHDFVMNRFTGWYEFVP